MGINITNIAQSHDEAQYLAELARRGTFTAVTTAVQWTQVVVGSGASSQSVLTVSVSSGATASSSALRYSALTNIDCGSSGTYNYIDWDLPFRVLFRVSRRTANTQAVGRVQVKQVNTIGVLDALGIGIQIDSLAISGESYGTAVTALDLSTSLVLEKSVLCEIRHNPTDATPNVTFATGSVGAALVIRGTQTTAAAVPIGNGTAGAQFVISIANGSNATGADLEVGPILIWYPT